MGLFLNHQNSIFGRQNDHFCNQFARHRYSNLAKWVYFWNTAMIFLTVKTVIFAANLHATDIRTSRNYFESPKFES